MSAVLIALAVALAGPIGAFAMAYLAGKQRQEERLAQWARDDELQRRIIEANGKLDKIEKLVDGAMLQQKRTELDGLDRELIMMRRLGHR